MMMSKGLLAYTWLKSCKGAQHNHQLPINLQDDSLSSPRVTLPAWQQLFTLAKWRNEARGMPRVTRTGCTDSAVIARHCATADHAAHAHGCVGFPNKHMLITPALCSPPLHQRPAASPSQHLMGQSLPPHTALTPWPSVLPHDQHLRDRDRHQHTSRNKPQVAAMGHMHTQLSPLQDRLLLPMKN